MGANMPLRILLAEDHPINQKLAIATLERFGYRPDVAANGMEVIDEPPNRYNVSSYGWDSDVEGLVKRLVVWLLALEVPFHQRVIELDDLVEELRVEARHCTEVALAFAVEETVDDFGPAV